MKQIAIASSAALATLFISRRQPRQHAPLRPPRAP